MTTVGALSGWHAGETVITTKPVFNIEKAGGLPEGTVGVLGHLYRTQEGREIWAVWVAGKQWTASHTTLRRLEPNAAS